MADEIGRINKYLHEDTGHERYNRNYMFYRRKSDNKKLNRANLIINENCSFIFYFTNKLFKI
jgi:hypothetical protein